MKKLSILLASSMLAGVAMAAPVSADRALQVARSFWANTLEAKGAEMLTLADWQYDRVHLALMPSGGWVMVAADDAVRPILAYSTSSTLDPTRLPGPAQDFIEVYQQEIALATSFGWAADAEWNLLESGLPLKGEGDEGVGPLVQTTWYQTFPYNQLCPSGTMTGCVATAMAQVMNFWKYPAFGEGSHTYTNSSGYGPHSADFASTHFDWEHMPTRLTGNSSVAEKTAVATLMYCCGVAVNMYYGLQYSGAVQTDIGPAMTDYFHYNRSTTRYLSKGNRSNDVWTDTLIAELGYRRPIIYGGTGSAGGHCFICDGFDTRRYLHFNLGEDGAGDGYYLIGAITYGAYSFNQGNDCVLGVQPDYGFLVDQSRFDFSRQAESRSLWVCTVDTTDQPWTATPSDSWISVSNNAIDHIGQLQISVTENTTGAERQGTVTFSQAGHTTVVTIAQAAYDPSTDYCPLTIMMENTHNEPWPSDSYLSFESPTGLIYGTARHSANSGSSTATVNVAPHDVMCRWHGSSATDRYVNYKVVNQHGDVLIEVENAYFDGQDVLIEWPCAHAAIGDVQAVDFQIVPNPATNMVRLQGIEDAAKIELIDATGRRVLSTEGNQVDVAALPAGVYLVRVLGSDGVGLRKLVKQ